MNSQGVSIKPVQAHQLPVKSFEPTLLWPVQLQAIRHADQSYLNKKLDPDKPGFLMRWADAIVGEADSSWRLREGVYPADHGPEYAEYVYFHPFVRNFLYATRGDIRASADGGSHQNRNLVILEHELSNDQSNELIVSFRMKIRGGEQAVALRSRFSIRSCWLYLFDTQIAILELALQYQDTSIAHGNSAGTPVELDLAMVMKLQDIIRRTYSAYWSVFSSNNSDEIVVDSAHVPEQLELVRNGEQAATAVFGQTMFSAGKIRQKATDESDSAHARQALHQALELVRQDSEESDDQPAVSDNEQLKAIAQQTDFLSQNREPHTNNILQELVYPLTPVMLQNPTDRHCGLQFEHIQDDRIPMMSYIAMGVPPASSESGNAVRLISDGDWLRLAMLDDPGDSNTFPYSPDFFDADNPLQGFAYDRFWHPTGQGSGAADWHDTRWLCSGFSFVAVGNARNPFFTDDYAGALAFYRHHYYALFMIGIMHRASLLQYKHRLAEAVDSDVLGKDLKAVDRPQDELDYYFRRRTDNLQRELLRFRTMYWFSEVSNQIQGQELFAMLRRHLNLDSLFNDVSQDVEMATELVSSWEERQRSEVGYALTVVGAFFVLLAPLGIFLDKMLTGAIWWVSALFVMAVIFIQAGVFAMVISLPGRWKWDTTPRIASYMRRASRFTRAQMVWRCWIVGAMLLVCSLVGHQISTADAAAQVTNSTVSP